MILNIKRLHDVRTSFLCDLELRIGKISGRCRVRHCCEHGKENGGRTRGRAFPAGHPRMSVLFYAPATSSLPRLLARRRLAIESF